MSPGPGPGRAVTVTVTVTVTERSRSTGRQPEARSLSGCERIRPAGRARQRRRILRRVRRPPESASVNLGCRAAFVSDWQRAHGADSERRGRHCGRARSRRSAAATRNARAAASLRPLGHTRAGPAPGCYRHAGVSLDSVSFRSQRPTAAA